jgi:hypothetical protein
MTKNELLVDLASRFTAVVMTEANPQNAENLPVKRYRSVVLETKTIDSVPIAIQRAVEFYVLNESTETELAYYMKEEPKSILTGEASPGQG